MTSNAVTSRAPLFVLILAACALLFPAGKAGALTLTVAEYTFDGGSLAPTFIGNGFTASSFTGTNTGTFTTGSVGFLTDPVFRIAPPDSSTQSAAAAVANDVKFSFTVDSSQFNLLGLQSLEFDGARGGGSEPRGFVLRTSATGSQDILVESIPTVRPTFTPYAVDLSAIPELQDLSGPVTFDFYTFAPSSGTTVEFDNFRLTATVPEPTRVLLLGLAGLPLLLRRRR